MDVTNWRKSSRSGGNGGECVEVGTADRVMVRDTTDREGPMLGFTPQAWATFLADLKD